MKRYFFLSIIFSAASTAFAANQNMYQCVDTNGNYEVSYTSSSFVGKPTMDVRLNGKSVVDRTLNSLPDISHDQTVFGTLANLAVTHTRIADAPTQIYSLVIPHVPQQGQITFESKLLIGSTGGFMPATEPTQRISEVVDVECSAQKVFF